MHKWISVRRKWWILTYCCRNVSVGRVIGIHIGRVMGRGEHSVVVDSESWTETTEKTQWFTPIQAHNRRHRRTVESKATGGTWCTGMRQSDAELRAQRQHSKRTQGDSTHHAQVYTRSLDNFISSLTTRQHCCKVQRIMIISLHFYYKILHVNYSNILNNKLPYLSDHLFKQSKSEHSSTFNKTQWLCLEGGLMKNRLRTRKKKNI